MAVPRKRKSHSRRRQQRSHDALQRPILSKCPSCGAPRMPHRICGVCGWYADRTAVVVEAD